MTYREPPEGWFTFGTHVDKPGPLEFSEELDEGGMPLWERPAQLAVLSQWVIYAGTRDYPGRFVVRRWDIVQGNPEPVATDDLTVHFTIDSARNAVPPIADVCFPRSPTDDPTIVEVWT